MLPTLNSVVVCPNPFSFSAARRASRSHGRRRPSPRRSFGLQGDRVLARRGSWQLRRWDKLSVAPCGRHWLRADSLATPILGKHGTSRFAVNKHDRAAALVAAQSLAGIACFSAPLDLPSFVSRHRFHFLSPGWRPFGLFLSSDHRLTQPLGFVKVGKQLFSTFFRAAGGSHTHNPKVEGRTGNGGAK